MTAVISRRNLAAELFTSGYRGVWVIASVNFSFGAYLTAVDNGTSRLKAGLKTQPLSQIILPG
jgi:hypothetical protein